MKPIRSTCRRGTRMPTPMAVSVTTAPLCRSPISLASRVSLMMLRHTLLILWLVLALLAGCSRSDETGFETPATIAAGTDFLMFPNPQASLGVGDYNVVFSNITLPLSPAAYVLTVIYSDGTSEAFTGTWTTGQTVTQPIEVKRAGGITILLNSSGATASLTLGVTGAASTVASTSGVNPSITLSRFKIDEIAYAQAYYQASDPGNNKDTLEKWKAANGFGACDYEVRFRDVHDLGYGRHMCARRDIGTGDIAVWVENFQVTAVPGQNYGPLNLEAVVNDDRRWHVSTNAIEYSPVTLGGVKFVKFYTFTPTGERKL